MSMHSSHRYDGREAEDDFGTSHAHRHADFQKTLVQRLNVYDRALQIACPECNAPAHRVCTGIVVLADPMPRTMHAKRYESVRTGARP
jgi:hypothetical protein